MGSSAQSHTSQDCKARTLTFAQIQQAKVIYFLPSSSVYKPVEKLSVWFGYYHLQQSMLEMSFLSAKLFLIHKKVKYFLFSPHFYNKICLRYLSRLLLISPVTGIYGKTCVQT